MRLLKMFIIFLLLSFQSKLILPGIYLKVKGWKYDQHIILDLKTIRQGLEFYPSDSDYVLDKYMVLYELSKGDTFKKMMRNEPFYVDSFKAFSKIKTGEKIIIRDVRVKKTGMTTPIHGITIYVK